MTRYARHKQEIHARLLPPASIVILLGALSLLTSQARLLARPASPDPQQQTPTAGAEHDGSHDFDFEFGAWKTRISRLLHPLTGSTTWVQLEGTKVVRKVWGGRALLEEIEADGPAGHWEGLTLFLYNPQSRQWSLNFTNSRDGTFSQPAIGEFKNGRGEFFDQETYNGRAIFVRIVWSDIAPNSHRFEQSFSADGGKTWEPNFIAVLTRDDGAKPTANNSEMQPAQHDFDWQLGSWKIHMSRLQHPLAGSQTWAEWNGTVVVSKVWNGRANIAEIVADAPSGHLEFLSLRLYNPGSHQWSLNFASSNSGTLGVPMIGEFKNGRGEFYDQEPVDGRTILVRFVFSDVASAPTRDEQAFSDDGGKTWEVNWINTQTRLNDDSDKSN